jgi:hypothetical protein
LASLAVALTDGAPDFVILLVRDILYCTYSVRAGVVLAEEGQRTK